jgi:hypothetical protein
MPNIIEQQDLLKGLPNTRLAMLLQNPTGDIPLFLVAAEAQRRHALAQQFAGSEGKESVVDTLTKQLANVPQNIPAPTRSPPMIPQTPQMQGVAALQAQQSAQQMAQPQGMRAGGMVQRYQSAGVVMPLQQRIQSIMDQFGVDAGEAERMLQNNPSVGAPKIEGDLGKPFYVPETNQEPAATPLELNIPVLTTSPEEYAKRQRELMRERKYQEMESYPGYSGDMSKFKPAPVRRAEEEERMRDYNADRRRLADQKTQASPSAGTPPPEPGETQDEYRARLEKLLAAQQPSDWEKAQGYFAMAEQFLDPSKTTMQSIAGAGQAFAQSAGEQARAQREAELARERGLLEYDIGERDRKVAIEAERAKREYETQQKILERRNPPAADVLRTLGSLIQDIDGRISKMSEFGAMTDPKAIENLEAQKRAYMMQMAEILKGAGYGPSGAITLDQLRALAGQQ